MLATKIARCLALKMFRVWLATLCGSSLALAAQEPPACRGPAELEQIIASHPSAGAYDALGAYFGQRRQFPCAFTAFESALRLEPNSWEARYNLALALLESGNAERAVRELRVAARLRPATPLTHTTLGMALGELGRIDAAIAEFQTALKLDPKSVPALDGLTKALIDQKRYTAAISRLKNAPADEALQLNLEKA